MSGQLKHSIQTQLGGPLKVSRSFSVIRTTCKAKRVKLDKESDRGTDNECGLICEVARLSRNLLSVALDATKPGFNCSAAVCAKKFFPSFNSP